MFVRGRAYFLVAWLWYLGSSRAFLSRPRTVSSPTSIEAAAVGKNLLHILSHRHLFTGVVFSLWPMFYLVLNSGHVTSYLPYLFVQGLPFLPEKPTRSDQRVI